MVALRIRHLELRATTEKGPFGIRLQFDDGLVVLRADNSSGKSTCLMSILYALGLEGMLSPSHVPPLGEAMVRRLNSEHGLLAVTESVVTLEIENADHERMTVQRSVTGNTKQRELIITYNGGYLSNPTASFERQDYFVRIAGAAQSDKGFHTRLAEFIGIDPPYVPRYDGAPVPLYLECIFPLLFVEQITGWQALENRMPTHLRIIDPWQRSLEFLLALDVHGLALKAHELQLEKRELERKWTQRVYEAKTAARAIGYVPLNLPNTPVAEWPTNPPTRLEVTDGRVWQSLEDELNRRRAQLVAARMLPIASVAEATPELLVASAATEASLDDSHRAVEELSRDLRLDREQLLALEQRLTALKKNLQDYKDEQRLHVRGALSQTPLAKGECAYCGQPIKDTLAAQSKSAQPMPLETNIAFIADQIDLFDEMRRDTSRALEAKEQDLMAMRLNVRELTLTAQSQRRSLRSDPNSPSESAIRDKLILEDRIGSLEALEKDFQAISEEFRKLAEAWAAVVAALKGASSNRLTDTDRARLAQLLKSFIEQLKAYGFRSFDPNEIMISYYHFRPIRDNHDLWGMSASDTIRTIWAYLIALLELARGGQLNHPGLLILDEPRQQSADKVSFSALLKRAGTAGGFHQQVIFATSEDETVLKGMLADVPHQWHSLPPRILQPLR